MLKLEKIKTHNFDLKLKASECFLLKELSFGDLLDLADLYFWHPFRAYQNQHSKEWDQLLLSWLDEEVPFTVGKHTVTFYFSDNKEVEVWRGNPWFSYATCYRINNNKEFDRYRPSLSTIWKFHLMVKEQDRIQKEAKHKEKISELNSLRY